MRGALRLLGSLAVVCAVSSASVVSVAAQNAVLYEVTEAMKLKVKDDKPYRTATAQLFGAIAPGPSICPEPLTQVLGIPACGLTAVAKNAIDLTTGSGPVNGKFAVVVPGDNPVDSAELVIAEGHLEGFMDLSAAVLGPDGVPQSGDEVPLGTISGTWRAKGVSGGPLNGVKVGGTFSGTFRLPFELPGLGAAYMLNPYAFPGPGSFVTVAADEHSIGMPAVRLDLTFIETARSRRDSD